MLFNIYSVASLLALGTLSNAASPQWKSKRATTSGVTLYAYGTSANGAPIFYSDGLAYFGNAEAWINSTTQTTTTYITYTLDGDDSSVPWSITANASSVSFNETLDMYVVPTTGSFTQVGFLPENSSSLPTGAVQTGFGWFGKSVAYIANGTDYEIMFWANATVVDGVYSLYWNAAAATADIPTGAFAVTVKSTRPIDLS